MECKPFQDSIVFEGKAGAYPSEVPFKNLTRGEHSSLLQTLQNYGRKKFYNIGAWWSNMEEGREQHILKCQQVLEALTTLLYFRIFLNGDH